MEYGRSFSSLTVEPNCCQSWSQSQRAKAAGQKLLAFVIYRVDSLVDVVKTKRKIARIPILGRILTVVFRTGVAASYLSGPIASAFKWLFLSREFTNFTYDLLPLNKRYLAVFIATITKMDATVIQKYFDEIEQDQVLRDHILTAMAKSEDA